MYIIHIHVYVSHHIHTIQACIDAALASSGDAEISSLAVPALSGGVRRGADGVGTNGVAAIFTFFDRGTFWVPVLTYFCLPRSARAYLFPQSVKDHYFLQRSH